MLNFLGICDYLMQQHSRSAGLQRLSPEIMDDIDTLSGEVILSKLFCLPTGKGSTLKRKEFSPLGRRNDFMIPLILEMIS